MGAHVATAVVGAGPAGLAVSAALAGFGHDHVVLERGRIAESWRSQRWDGFHLNTPNWMNRAPRSTAAFGGPDAFLSRDEHVANLGRYARTLKLPVRTGVEVEAARPAAGGWLLHTSDGTLHADDVVVASGALNRPRHPDMALPGAEQLHIASYRRADALPPGGVLIVGAGQSGVQVAEDLLEAGRDVYLATSRVSRVPRRYRGRDFTEWMAEMGIYDQSPADVPPAGRRGTQPQISGANGGHTLTLQQLARDGAVLLGRLVGAEGRRLRFADDLAENLAFADAASERFKRNVDAHVARTGAQAPPPVPEACEVPLEPVASPRTLFLGVEVGSVVWATGFGGTYDWLPAEALGRTGRARAGVPGLHLMGQPWQLRRASANLHGIGRDAPIVAAAIARERELALAA